MIQKSDLQKLATMSSSDDSSSDSESDDEMRRNIMASYYGKGLNEQVRERERKMGDWGRI